MPRLPPSRRSLRLREYDYTNAGGYFVTVCTRGRVCCLGEVCDAEMRPNAEGAIVREVLLGLPCRYPRIAVDACVVMPNHLHAIVILLDEVGRFSSSERAGLRPAPTGRVSLSEVVRALKSFSARGINGLRGTTGIPVWQRGYHEHIVRDDGDLRRIRQYIEENPTRWEFDDENPNRPMRLP